MYVDSSQFSVDSFLAENLEHIPLRAEYIGADPRKAKSLPTDLFSAQWFDVCSLTLPPNGFSSQPWWNNKVVRKEKWHSWGLDKNYLVPTLYHTYITTGVVHDGPGDQFYVDDEGQLTLDWPKPRVFHIPQDANCQAELTQILRSHGRIVLKPIEGNRAEGVMLVSVAASADADSHDMDVTVCRHTSEVRLIKTGDERMRFSSWFQECIQHNPHLKTGILLEPMIEWDNEIKCISLSGGKIIVIGSAGGGLARSDFAHAAHRGNHSAVDPIVIVNGRQPLVLLQNNTHDARREKYQLSQHVPLQGGADLSPSEMLIQCNDISGRKMWEVVRDSIQTVTPHVSITRVDFFVKYPRVRKEISKVFSCVVRALHRHGDDEFGSVLINEVEHGFDAGLLPSWFGMQMAELICKVWVLLGATQEVRDEFARKRYGSQSTDEKR